MKYAGIIATLIVALLCCSAAALAQQLPSGANQARSLQAKSAPATVEVIVVHGTNSGKGIDKRLAHIKELKQGPFVAWKSYQQLSRSKKPLVKNGARFPLPNTHTLVVALKEKLADGRLKIAASIVKPGKKKSLPLLMVNAKPGRLLMIAGHKYKKGILVMGIRVLKKK